MATTTTVTPTATSTTAESPKLVKKMSMSEVRSPSATIQTSFGCQHIKGLLQAARGPATDGYTRAIQSLRQNGHVTDKLCKDGEKVVTTASVTYLCLQCPNVSTARERHRKDHLFAIESTNGFILCHECKDFVYDPTFEEIRTSNSKKRKRYTLQAEDKRLVSTNTVATPCAATGLRGLYNMGQTCFMSVILQSLIHNPLIRSFYLSEGHRSLDCERDACTSCAFDELFLDFYKEEKHEGYGAVHMLQGCWKGGGGLAGYSQQDAHEYLGFILNNLHTANTADDDDDSDRKVLDSGKDCDCVIHQTFGGVLQSTVTCSKCQNTTTAYDPFMDLSLDIRNSGTVTMKKKKLALINGTTTVKETLPVELTECLDRFTSAETLSADNYTCRACDSPQEARKRLMLHRVPPVVPIHLKRFSHSKSLSQSSKVDTKIRFPFTLDLTPYFASSTAKKKKHKSDSDQNGQSEDKKIDDATTSEDFDVDMPILEPIYELSSVVVHKGKIDNGHYVSYSCQDRKWFRFDDSMVVQVSEREVLNAEAYMLFYVAREF